MAPFNAPKLRGARGTPDKGACGPGPGPGRAGGGQPRRKKLTLCWVVGRQALFCRARSEPRCEEGGGVTLRQGVGRGSGAEDPLEPQNPPAGGWRGWIKLRSTQLGASGPGHCTGPLHPRGEWGRAGGRVGQDWRGEEGRRGGGKRRAERDGGRGESQQADAAAQIKLLPVVNFIHEVVDQNVI